MSERAVKVPDLGGRSAAQIEVAVGALAEELPAHISLQAAVGMNQHTITMLTATVERMGQRHQDLAELLSIAKSAQELTRKIDRLAKRLLAEEDPGGA